MKTFRIKNWDELQHYKDRDPPWIKLYVRLLDKYEYGRLPDASKAHLIAIWLLASRSKNVLPYDPEWIGKRINATCPVELDLLLAFDFIELIQDDTKPEQDASAPLAKCLARGEESRDREEKKDALANAHAPENLQGEFDEWYEAFPLHVARGRAWKAYKAARRKTDAKTLMEGARRYAVDPSRKPDFTAHPATWLNGERWLDAGARPTQKPHAVAPAIGSPEWQEQQRRLMGDAA